MDDDFLSAEEEEEKLVLGERFRGYAIERRIGRGAAGDVYLARHEMLDILYAIKVLNAAESFADGESARRFVREAKISARIQHPNLVRVHDAGYDEKKGFYYLVMDYMPGGTLRDRIAFGGVVPAKEALDIVRCIASALDAGARMGLVHRDLKPENIMFSESGVAKLVDLGIAKVCDGDTLHTRTSATFGTPAYVAPEQALDASKVDSRADIYSLGVILFEMLCGRRPYAGETPMAIISQVISDEPIPDVKRLNPDVPNWAAALVLRMCAKNVDKRIASADELLRIIDTYLHKGRESADYSSKPDRNPIPSVSDFLSDPEVNAGISRIRNQRKDFMLKLLLTAGLAVAISGAIFFVLSVRKGG